jgi:hypothetical protein
MAARQSRFGDEDDCDLIFQWMLGAAQRANLRQKSRRPLPNACYRSSQMQTCHSMSTFSAQVYFNVKDYSMTRQKQQWKPIQVAQGLKIIESGRFGLESCFSASH